LQTTQIENDKVQSKQKIDGVVIGLFLSINNKGLPMVAYPGNTEETAVTARSTVAMQNDDIGCEVALVFEEGEPGKPMIIGKIQHVDTDNNMQKNEPVNAVLDGESIVLSARQNITLKCGKASITLTKSGKVILRGAYLLSRSSGVNRVKGGSVQIN